MRRWVLILFLVAFLYGAIGFSFHLKWKSDWRACQALKASRGEFVETEVYGGILGLAFSMTYWPVYTWANIYHFGTPFPPCRLAD
ncbi:MAG: hypothetical protein RML93_11750 [Anaerolineales bacterium]|nr:hypothetical protein [Anaerolineales bacterium]MDW8447948.1 hypothetical protein [Anaerolineales bacterium]